MIVANRDTAPHTANEFIRRQIAAARADESGDNADPESYMDPDAASAEAAPSGMDEAMRRAESLYEDNPFGQLTNAHPES